MRLSCPSCQTEYDVPDAALTGRPRTLRCVTCGHQWQTGQLAPPPAPPAASPPSPPPPAAPPAAAQPKPAIAPEAALAAATSYLRRPQPDETPAATPSWPPAADRLRTPQTTPLPDPIPALPMPDPFEVRSQSDRESFAALLESSRQDRAQPNPRRRRKKPGPNPWLVSILLLLFLAALAWLEHPRIEHIWPPSTRLFNAVAGLVHK